MESVTRPLAGIEDYLECGAADTDLVLRFESYLLDDIGSWLHGTSQTFRRWM